MRTWLYRIATASLAVLCLTTAGLAASSDLVWEFNQFSDPGSQGWRFQNFAQARVDPAAGLVHLEWQGTAPELVQPSYSKSFVPAKDYEAVEVKMKAGTTPGNALSLRLQWQRNGVKTPGVLTLPVDADQKFHVYRFDLAKAAAWVGKDDFVRVSLLPTCSPNSGAAAIDIDSIKFVPTLAAALAELSAVADTRLSAAESSLAGFERRGINVPGAAADLAALRQGFMRTMATGEKALPLFAPLERLFSGVYRKLDCGRRLEMLDESAQAISKTLAFRRTQGESVPTAAPDTLDTLRQELAAGKFPEVEAGLAAAEQRQRAFWNALCEGDGKATPWQLGVSDASFGRFGWELKLTGLVFQGDGRESLSRGGYFVCANGYNQNLRFSPVGAKYSGQRTLKDASWVSGEWEHLYKTAAGKEVSWDFKHSLLAPGTLLETNAAAVSFSINVGKDFGPTAILAPTADGPKLFPFSPETTQIPLSENWMLLLCDNGFPAVPWLLTFQKRPDSFTWTKEDLVVQRAGGVGRVGMSNPWGVRPLPIDFSKGWAAAPPDAVAQSRRIAAIMNCYPYKCDEYFAVDKREGKISVAEVVHHLKLENDWDTEGVRVAPLPPVLAFAAETGYPATLPKDLVDYGMPTIYGPYLAKQGDQVAYSLPIPDLRYPTPLKTSAFPQRQAEANDLVKTFYPVRLESMLGGATASYSNVLPSWCLLDAQSQQILEENGRLSFLKYFDIIGKLGTFDLNSANFTLERTEPFTGLPYMVYGWNVMSNGQRVYGDITNFVGFKLYPLYLHCMYSGDWKMLRDNWSKVLRIFEVCPRRCDWAVMGQSCMEQYFLHSIDMGPDSWCAPVAMVNLAEAMGDLRSADLALYMAAKQAVPLTTAFSKRKWDERFNSRFDERLDVPESGYTDSGYVCPGWNKVSLLYNFIIGCIHSPECLNLYRDFCPDAAKLFEYSTMERFNPQWHDPKFMDYGKNSPGPVSHHLLLREALGEPTDKLEALLGQALLENSGEPLGKYLEMGELPALKSISVAFLVGRDAPCQLAAWTPARLLAAEYDDTSRKVTANFLSSSPFTVSVISQTKPAAVNVGGDVLPASKWSFAASRRELLIPVEQTGKVTVVLNYPGWTPPNRPPLAAPPQQTTVTPETLICKAERQRAGKIATTEDNYQIGEALCLDIAPRLNMDLRCAAPCPWLGRHLAPGENPESSGVMALPKGLQVFRGVPFQVADPRLNNGHAALGLVGAKTTGPINLDGTFKTLYFLQAAAYGDTNGEPVLRYVIKYADGSSSVLEVRPEREIADWLRPSDVANGKLLRVKTGAEKNAGLFVVAWHNTQYEVIAVQNAIETQRPLRKIASVEIESTGKADAVAILAITGEKP